MPTIRDVAQRAGVAPVTVSRVINNSLYVNAETRDRVEATIAELQYVPSTLACSLRSKKTRVLAMVVFLHESGRRARHPHWWGTRADALTNSIRRI